MEIFATLVHAYLENKIITLFISSAQAYLWRKIGRALNRIAKISNLLSVLASSSPLLLWAHLEELMMLSSLSLALNGILITNERGELLSVRLTKGNVDDRQPVPKMIKDIFGSLFGDKGCLSGKLAEKLRSNGIKLITTIPKNMKNKLMPLFDRIMLRKRFIIETINDKLKNECQIEHTRHRSPANFLINILPGLACYQMTPKKPALKMPTNFNRLLIA